EITAASYAARAKKIPEDPAMRVLSRSKKAATRSPAGDALAPSRPPAPRGSRSCTTRPSRGRSSGSGRAARSAMRTGGLGHLEDDGVALATARADRRTAQPAAAAPQLEHQAAENAGARGADRVAERDRAAVYVDPVLL